MTRIYVFSTLSILLLSSFSGCYGNTVVPTYGYDSELNDFGAFSVVAPIDTGINVYHDHFVMEEDYPQWLLDGLGVTKICDITNYGSWEERYSSDKESCWDTIVSTDIVWFKGTRIIGTTPDDDTDIPILDDPQDGHGTAVTGLSLIHI